MIANVQVSGRDGGHDLNYRTLQAIGVNLLGHFLGAEHDVAHFAPDLAESVAFGDARLADLCELIRKSCAERAIEPPDMAPPPPFAAGPPERLDLKAIGAVIFTSGFRPDYTSWVGFPEAFDEMGFPSREDRYRERSTRNEKLKALKRDRTPFFRLNQHIEPDENSCPAKP